MHQNRSNRVWMTHEGRNLTTSASRDNRAEVTATAIDAYQAAIVTVETALPPMIAVYPRVVAVTEARKAALAERLM